MISVLYAIRNCVVGDDEQSRLMDDVAETIKEFKKDGVSEEDLYKLNRILMDRAKGWEGEVIRILTPYARKALMGLAESHSLVEVPKDDGELVLVVADLMDLYFAIDDL